MIVQITRLFLKHFPLINNILFLFVVLWVPKMMIPISTRILSKHSEYQPILVFSTRCKLFNPTGHSFENLPTNHPSPLDHLLTTRGSYINQDLHHAWSSIATIFIKTYNVTSYHLFTSFIINNTFTLHISSHRFIFSNLS